MLVRCRILSTADADRTPSIDVCRFFRYSRSSVEIVERLMKLSLIFGGLTTLVAHLLTSRTLGRNPRVLIENPAPTLYLFFSVLFFSFLMHKVFSCHPFSLGSDVRTPHLLFLFKNSARCVFTVFSPCERIKLGGCSLEFKSNLNSNANQPILIHSRCEKRRGVGSLCVENLHDKLFLM